MLRLLCAPQCPHHICASKFRLMRLRLGARSDTSMRGSEIAAIYGSIKGLRYKPSSAADRVPFRRLSAPFAAATVDLQARVDSAAAAAELPPAMWEFDEMLSICTSAGGIWNAVAIWFEVRAEEAGSAGVFTGGEEKFVGAGAAIKPQRDTLVLRI